MKAKIKYSYVVMQSMFGNLWVGKTKLKPNGVNVFADFDDATEEAKVLNESIENVVELTCASEEDCELVDEKMEKWILER